MEEQFQALNILGEQLLVTALVLLLLLGVTLDVRFTSVWIFQFDVKHYFSI